MSAVVVGDEVMMANGQEFVDLVSFLAAGPAQDPPRRSGRRVIPSERVRIEPHPVPLRGGGHQSGEPKVRVHTRDNVVHRIEIVCACGRTIELVLDYGNGRTAQGQRP